ncbi:hypothetical protein [Nitrosopumilus sp.]|uniref:hypothetical protein n=1 Tax=Nitrosopumilus sp. TaxID=2024843 RepID=UPI00247CA6F8|nr:hypothetical protein [Nitrosopumilus sp.]MCV0409925.1 hypothetical protein [Nitrosopumilus sp.]
MHTTLFFFFIILISFNITSVYAETIHAYLLADGETNFADDEIVLDNDETLDISKNVITSDVIIKKTVGKVTVDLTQEVKLVSKKAGETITLKNPQLTTVNVKIPDKTLVLAPATWDKKIFPPKTIAASGTVQSGFQTPTSSILVGSPDVVFLFDKVVTIILEGTTGQIAYKLPGQTSWILISTCLGTYDAPTDPPVNGECSISNGVDTKIMTFHFTEFTSLSTTPETSTITSTPTSSSGSSGGGGGKRSSSGAPSSSAEHAGRILPEGAISEARAFPNWFQTSLVTYWIENLITDNEFKNAMNYMLNKNIIKIDVGEEKDIPTLDLAPSIKQLFRLWSLDKLTDSTIIEIIIYYRTVGAW